ncbi:MAG: pitrilysin family protein [Hyphomonadaceae bacterium]
MSGPAASPRILTLENGVRIALDTSSHARTASFGVWFAAGARHDPAGKGGLAHLLEHMTFKGADGRTAREIAELVEARGASINAATEYERTSYTMRCLPQDAPALMSVLLSLPLGADLPGDELAKEIDVVLQEMSEAADDPEDLVFETAQAANFGDHPLGRPILGIDASVRSITRDDLRAFLSGEYDPRRIVVSVSGSFDEGAMLAAIESRLAPLAQSALSVTSQPTPPKAAVRSVTRKTEQCHLVIGGLSAPIGSPQRIAVSLFTEVLGGGMASRLFQDVREARGLVYSIDASSDAYTDAGRMQVYCGCAAKNVGEVLDLTLGIWGELAANGPTPAELDRARTVLEAHLAMAADSPVARAGMAAHDLFTFGRLRDPGEIIEQIRAVTARDLMAFGELSRSAGPVIAYVGPAAGARAAEGRLKGF